MRVENSSNNLKFKAILKVKLPEERWETISKKFKDVTPRSNYRLHLFKDSDILFLSAKNLDRRNHLTESLVAFSDIAVKKLMSLSDDKIVEKLKKYLDICRETDSLKDDAFTFWQNLSLNDTIGSLQIYDGLPDEKITLGKTLIKHMENAICRTKVGKMCEDDIFRFVNIVEF